MSKKIALAFAASCLTAVAAVVPVAASAQDLGSLSDLSSLSVSLFDDYQKPSSTSTSAAPSTSASTAPSTSSAAPTTTSEPAPVVPEPTVPPRLIGEKTDYDAQVAAFRKYLMGPAGKQTFNVSMATGDNASGYLLVAGNHYNRIAAGQGYTPSGREDTARLDKLVKQHNCDADDAACGSKLYQDIVKEFPTFNGFTEKSVALAVANFYGYRSQD